MEFNTPLDYFEYLVVLVGLTKHSPTMFHVLVTDVLGHFLNIFVFSLLQQLTEICLYVFHTPSVTFLSCVFRGLRGGRATFCNMD